MPNILAGVEQFVSLGTASVTLGGTGTPAAGTQETWTVASAAQLPAANSSGTPPTGFYVADTAQPSEVIQVKNISGTSVTVIRGADGTTPVAHSTPFTVLQVAAGDTLRRMQIPDWLNVLWFGADPTGTNDSTAAFQAAINARGTTAPSDATFTLGTTQAIFVPYGTYKISSGPLKPTTPLRSLRIIGDDATLTTSANALFDFNGLGGNLLEGFIEISGLKMDVTGGHVFQNANVHGMVHIHHCDITQRSTGFGVWNNDDIANANASGSGIYTAQFDHINYWLGTGTRTVEAWRFVTNLNQAFGNITWEYVNGPNPPGSTTNDASMDTSHYQYYLQCSGASQGTQCSSISWRNCLFADAFGGLIKCAGISNIIIDGVNWENAFDGVIANDAYTFIADPVNATPCSGIVIRNCYRDTNLGSQAGHAPPYDVSFAATCNDVMIQDYVIQWFNGQGPYFNLNACAGALVVANNSHSSTPTISNKASDTIVIGNGKVQGGTGWTTMSGFGTGFAAGGTTPRYQYEPVNGGRVRLAGTINVTATTAANATMFTLPAGFRPPGQVNFPCYSGGASVLGIAVTSGGVMQLVNASSNGNFVILDGITFPLD